MKKSHITALVIFSATSLWVASGLIFTSGDNAESEDAGIGNTQENEIIGVRARLITAEARRDDVIVRGRTEALRRVYVKAEIDGRVVALPVNKGKRVRKGEVICRLAINDREARRAEAQALLRQRQLEFNAAQSLSKKGYRADTQLAGAAARLDASKAEVARIELEIDRTAIRSPFSGVVDERPVEIGDFLQHGQVCAAVVDLDPFLVVGQVSERDVGLLTAGVRGTARMMTGETVEGTVRYIATTADPSTRTFRIELEVPNPDFVLRDGVTAEIVLPVREITAHLISPSLLTLNNQGVVGVRLVDEDSKAQFFPVDLINDSAAGVWVAGLPATSKIITVGQEFVREGQEVKVTLESFRP